MNADPLFVGTVIEQELVATFGADHLLVLVLRAIGRRLVFSVVEASQDHWQPHVPVNESHQHFISSFGDKECAVAVAGIELAYPAPLGFHLIIEPGELTFHAAFLTVFVFAFVHDSLYHAVEALVGRTRARDRGGAHALVPPST